jgi:hypothetical protein
MNYFGIFFLAVIVEGIVTYIKEFFVNGKFQWQMLVSIAIGVLVSAAYQVDLLALMGMKTAVPYLGSVLTGILISRGSNYIFDFIKTIGTIQTKTV